MRLRVTRDPSCVSGGVPEQAWPLPASGLTELSARLRAHWRADEEEWLRAAADHWLHARDLGDVAREFAARGDRIAVEVAGRRFEGVVVAVGGDRLDLRTATVTVSVRLALADTRRAPAAPIVLRRIDAARAGGLRPPAALVTFRARLLELESLGRPVRVGSALLGGECTGRITVGRDHVVVSDGGELVVPACWVAYVATADGEPAP